MAQNIGTDDFHRGQFDYEQYVDATYRYHCRALPGTPLADPSWVIMREKLDGTSVRFCQGSREAKFSATNLSTVQAYFA